MENQESVTAIDVRAFFQIIRKRIWLIIAIIVVTTSISIFISFYMLEPVYEAKISVVLIKAQDNIQNQQYDYNDIIMYQDLIKTYAQIAKSRTVAERAAEILKLNNIKSGSLLGKIIVESQEGTQIMNLKIQDLVPVMAKDKLNAFATSFIEEATRIFPNGNVQIIDDVITPEHPISPNKKNNVMIAFFLGLMISIGLTILMELFDNTIKSEAEIEKHLEINVLGIIPLTAKNT